MAEPDTSLKSNFQRQSCPANLPVYDPGIDPQGFKIPVHEVLGSILRQPERVVVWGDTNHYNPILLRPLEDDRVLETLKNGSVKHIATEAGKKHQPTIDAHYDGALTKEEMEDKFVAEGVAEYKGSYDFVLLHAKLAEYGAKNDIKLHAINPRNGYVTDENGNTTFSMSARLQDDQLVSDLNGLDGKTLLAYGAAHGSVSNSGFDAINGGYIKMDVHRDRQHYDYAKAQTKENHEQGGEPTNEVKPHLVYFLNQGTVHTTCATPPALKADIERVAANFAASIPTAAPDNIVPNQDKVTVGYAVP